MQQRSDHPISRFVVCASRSPAEAGNQCVGHAEIRRAALRTKSSNTNSRWRAPDPVVESKMQVCVVVPLEFKPRYRSAPPGSNGCLCSAPIAVLSASKARTVGKHWAARASAKTEHRSQGCRARCLQHRRVRPNPSFKRSVNGRPPAPGRWYGVHFHRPGAGVLPLAPT